MRKSTLILVIIFFFCSFNSVAKIDIHFSKVQFYLNDQSRTDSFSIRNLGNETANCSLGLTHYQISEDAEIKRIKDGVDGAYNPANKLIRYSPRFVKIPQQSPQSVRISFRRIPKLKDGEYVSFLRVKCNSDSKKANEANVTYNLPVIIRHGIVNSNNKITSAKLMQKDKNNVVEIIHERLVDSTSSIIGNYEVIGKESGDRYAVVKQSKIYVPAKFKKIILKFTGEITEPLQVKFTMEQKLSEEVIIVDVTD